MDRKNPDVLFLDEAKDFIRMQPEKAREKIMFNIAKIKNGLSSPEILKKLEGNEIWELRTLFNRAHYRLFAFWDTERAALIVATHGVVKKTGKVPAKEIRKAENIRIEYFNNKHKENDTDESDNLR